MTKRMLIDATHAEETRVVVLDGNRLDDFDVEAATKKQLKGNIYLAKVVRVEPSLQAAFVEYGGGRHGFLAFGEIHPDYYQIPVADRQRLLKMQAEDALAEEEAEDNDAPAAKPAVPSGTPSGTPSGAKPARGRRGRAATPAAALDAPAAATAYGEVEYGAVAHGALDLATPADGDAAGDTLDEPQADAPAQADPPEPAASEAAAEADNGSQLDIVERDATPPEELGGDDDVFEGNGAEEAAARRTSRFLRNYRIQEVIHRRQIMLIQVVKEERGTKGAALTTYISLAGRFCVLMPNSPRGGGISRKITSAADRRRLKEITAELELPQGMGLIVRTAGAARPKPEIKRDAEYLMRLWDDIRELTLKSMAPALIYEEANLIKRAIRDGYSRDFDEVVVDGEQGWRAARDFMRMLMPSHARKIQLWRPEGAGAGQPLFAKYGVEDQLDSMLVPTVQLKSGGYLVINQAEALVAIDVNSGKSTRERGIEETALRTNLEAAEEAARQLRLRDLAGLIVIDFIDMESKKNNAMVERRLKEALKNDRARIQVGQISHFGLLEMSRQRLRPSLTEHSFITCPHCAGMGLVRNVESSAVHVMREIEEEGAKARAGQIMVHAPNAVAMYILNNKRERLAEIEARFAMRVQFSSDESLVAPNIRIDRLRPPFSEEERAVLFARRAAPIAPPVLDMDDDADEELPDIGFEPPPPAPSPRVARAARVAEADSGHADDGPADAEKAEAPGGDAGTADLAGSNNDDAGAADTEAGGADATENGDEADRRPRRRRRRRGGRREEGDESPAAAQPDGEPAAPAAPAAPDSPASPAAGDDEPAPVAALAEDPAAQEQPSLDPEELDENGLPKARRRGRRGGRRRRRDEAPEEAEAGDAEATAAAIKAVPDTMAPVTTAPVAAGPATTGPATTGPATPPSPTPPPPRAPAYAGPTPADPFGGAPFDIFDILERAELAEQAQAEAARASVPPPPAELAIPPVPADATAPSDIVAEVVPEPAVPAPTAPKPAPKPATVAPGPATDGPVAGPAVRPIVLGVDPVPVTERKRGFWKR